MSAVDELQEAVARMRRLAEAAVVEPWAAVSSSDEYLRRGDVTTVAAPGYRDVVCERAGDTAEHIAAWDPVVALAVADWLEHEIDRIEHDGKYNIFITPGEVRCALNVARAFGRDGVLEG